MRPRAASSSGHTRSSRLAADTQTSSSSFQARASKFLKNLSRLATGKKSSSDTCPYDSDGRHGQPKPYLSQPALVISALSPEDDELSSSTSPSPWSRSSPSNSDAPGTLGVGSRSLDLVDGGRNERAGGSGQPNAATKSRLPLVTTNHDGQSPNLLTLTTSPSSGRSVSFDIPRALSNKDDKPSKPNSVETRSPHANIQFADIPEDHLPIHVTSNPPLNPAETAWSPATSTLSQPPKIEGLPNLGGSIDPSLFLCTLHPAGQPAVDEVPNLTPDGTPSPPLRSPMPSKPPNYHDATSPPVPTPANISPNVLPPKRAALLRLSSLPPPAFTMNGEDGSVRFSPTPIARHFPPAVRPLPPTSIARRSSSPAPSLRSSASHTRLRSVPALAMDGTEDGGGDGDGSDDDEDNDDDHVPNALSPASEDEDDDDATTEREGSSTYVSASSSPVEPRHGPSTPRGPMDLDRTPVMKPLQDYFSIPPKRSDSVDWMGSSSNPNRASLTPRGRPAALYHQPSKSMVNLLSIQRRDLSVIDEETKGKGKAIDSVSSAAADNNVLPEGSRIQRRRSLPMFTEAAEPPPYPSLGLPARFARKIFPRDEEGKEQLPEYSNDIFLSAVLPRKLEFLSPGVQARDRKWRRTLCVLEGTGFRVLEPPAPALGIGTVGRWWEKQVGVRDLTSDAPVPKKARTTIPGSQKIDRDFDGDEEWTTVNPTASITASDGQSISPAKKSKLHSRGHLHPGDNTSGSSSRRASAETTREHGRLPISASQQSVSSATTNTTGRPSTSSHRRAASPMSTKSTQPDHDSYPQNCQPLRVYTLQHAESGLASDYLKRKNVIRVRMEGEQFLLQAPSVQAVVDWIEVSFPDRVLNCSSHWILTATFMRVFKLRLA
ncbi:hypothetical protein BJ322DRAFT_1045854 [Thelephora terrestris]|uniref:PH domain-containing protein n=1 Tax=Thelephora terrestris TaxID=56493 RepID=A0A9P6HIL7_9AGAM|nr:hypothetical protein BJ322DRAFT_1045854 [Thelephora terrestris]